MINTETNTITLAGKQLDTRTERLSYEQYLELADHIEKEEIDFDLSEVKIVVPSELENAGFDSTDCIELFEQLDGETDLDFTGPNVSGEWRIIKQDSIQLIAFEEIIEGDEYVLGCFASWFIANHFEMISIDVAEALQKAEAFSELGKLIQRQSRDEQREFVEDYLSTDGEGHHFAHYDHNQYEFKFGGSDFIAFRTN